MTTSQDDEQSRTWEALYALVREVLQQYGREDYLGRADYHVLSDNYGLQAISVAFHQLGMLRSSIIQELQTVLAKYPGWEIFIAIDIPGKEGIWPRMGLRIRAQEIIDELKRQYLPKEFQTLIFATNTARAN